VYGKGARLPVPGGARIPRPVGTGGEVCEASAEMSVSVVPDQASEDSARVRPRLGPRARQVLGIAALAALYYGAARLGYAFQFAGPVAAIVWLPVGVGISFLYLGGLRLWPGVVVGDLLANDYGALPVGSALGQTAGNVLEVLAATVLLQRLVPTGSPLDSVRGLGRMLFALAAGAAASATVGPFSLLLGGVIALDEVTHIWRTWWLGDFSGALVVVPLAIAWYRPAEHGDWRGRRLEAAVVLALVVGLTNLAFSSDAPLTYLVFPALIWAALRFGQRGATLAVAVAAAITMWDTTHFAGPFAFQSITSTVLVTQLYMAVAALSTLCLAAVVSERERFAERLGASRVRLVEAGDSERRRFEHDLHDGAQQRLTALAVRLDRGADVSRENPAQAAAMFEEAGAELALAIDELRQLAHGLHPAVLSQLGLASAIRDLATRSTVPIRLAAVPSGRLAERVEATGYFVFAEAVTNAQKHAHAASITARLAVVGSALTVDVADDGVGGAVASRGSGLEGLRDRVEAVGGSFALDSPPGRGTRVRASIPLAAGPSVRAV
jgi:signal transduction histidine kinase